jgi:hypothetical protein
VPNKRRVLQLWQSYPKEISSLHSFNPIEWWDSNQSVYGILCLWVFDTLSIPAMATECERTFSSAKKLITPERNALSDAAIEANERLKAWWDQGLIARDERAMMRDLGIRCSA